jgi:hypothetical protein
MLFTEVWGFDSDRAIKKTQPKSELRAYRPMRTRRFMSSAGCSDCGSDGKEFRTLARRITPQAAVRWMAAPSSLDAWRDKSEDYGS